jgi:hypothetical protein
MSRNTSPVNSNPEERVAGLVHDYDNPRGALKAIEAEPGGLAMVADPSFVELVQEHLWEKFDDVIRVESWLRYIFEQPVIDAYRDADKSEKFAANHDPDVQGIYQDPDAANPNADSRDNDFDISPTTPVEALRLIGRSENAEDVVELFAGTDFGYDSTFLKMALALLSECGHDQISSIEYIVTIFGEDCVSTITKKEESSAPLESC